LSKNKTIRFAFGTATDPGSSVWRIIVTKKPGDIYINNSPVGGDKFHISLHISGKFHVKLGDNDRYLLNPLCEENKDIYLGPLIVFFSDRRIFAPMEATGKVDKITWLGWPEENHYIHIKLIFTELTLNKVDLTTELLIAELSDIKMVGKKFNFYVIAEHIKMMETYIAEKKKNPDQLMEFKDGMPDGGEMIVVKNRENSPSFIEINTFNVIRV
jgi:hypothetical protein